MTDVEQGPPQNGIDILAADDNDNNKERPADIEQDMREMERRKRVEAIMSSKLFREELERIVDSARDGGGTSGILQQLSDIVGLPIARVGSAIKSNNCMLPINDIRGVESMGYAKGEKILRCKLAATFRLLDLYGWTQGGLGAQITARLKVDQEYFLVNPYGLLYHEVTASSLNKVDMQGQIVEQGTTNFGVSKTHFTLHSAVHAARPDIRCAIYIGCSPVVAISSLRTGLLPLTKDACVLGEITTYPYTGTVLDAEDRDRLVRNLGPNSKVMLLSNHGALCCGETIEEAFFAVCHIVQACETQLKLLPVGLDNLMLIPEETRKTIYEHSRRPPEDLAKKFAAVTTADEDAANVKEGVNKVIGNMPKWRVGGAEFEALMRMLDNAGYRTGYIYRHPLIKSDPPKPKNDVELPPAVSSLGYLLEEEEMFRQGIWKRGDLRKGGDRSRWLNSPNVYQKVEVLETGTPDPKKITKWVADSSPTHSTPVRIDDALQFVPAGTSTKEFKRIQQLIKDNRRADKISAGPQSHILEGVTWDEANRLKDATVTQAGDHVVLMGAASKGIIQRGFQHNATVYKAPYAKNPFDNVTDDEINEYKRTVERKKKSIHGEYTDTDFSESEPLSSLQTSGGQKQTTTTTTAAAVSQSEPEDAEHHVLRIQTQQAPVPSQAEVVMSDAYQTQKKQDAVNKDGARNMQNQIPNEHVYLENRKELRNKELINDLKNDVKFQRQKQKFASNSSELASNNYEIRGGDLASDVEQNVGKNLLNINRKLGLPQPLPDNTDCINNFFPKIRRSAGQQRLNCSCHTNCNGHTCQSHKYCCEPYPHEYFHSAPVYDIPGFDNFKQSRQCKNPLACGLIFEAIEKPYGPEHDLISNIPWSTASTPCNTTPRNIRFRQGRRYQVTTESFPYRTVSHFGFNSPIRQLQPDHKHIPSIIDAQKYVPLHKSSSYEEIFASPRYIDLCEKCFDQLLRLKPDFIPVRAHLRNLADMPSIANTIRGPSTGETAQITSVVKEADYEYIEAQPENVEHLNINSSLEPVPEVDEVCSLTDDKKNTAEPQSVVNESFLNKIMSLNYSDESSNMNYVPPLTPDTNFSVELKQLIDNSQTACEMHTVNTLRNVKQLPHGNFEITEIFDFGNWRDADNINSCQYETNAEELPLCIESNLENASLTKQLTEENVAEETQNMNHSKSEAYSEFVSAEDRNEESDGSTSAKLDKDNCNDDQLSDNDKREKRYKRKMEFQDLWEDHVHYYTNKEQFQKTDQQDEIKEQLTTTSNEEYEYEARQEIEEVYRPPPEEEEAVQVLEQEVFLGCSLIVRRGDTEKINEAITTTIISDEIDENSFASAHSCTETSSDHKTIAMDQTSDAQASFHNCELKRSVTFSIIADIDENDLELVDINDNNDKSSEQQQQESMQTADEQPTMNISNNNSELSWHLYLNTTEESAISEEADNEADEHSENNSLNSIERDILSKIAEHQLKQHDEIFNKIDTSIRNKLTPKRLNLLMQSDKQLQELLTDKEQCTNYKEKIINTVLLEDDEQPTTSAVALKRIEIWEMMQDDSSETSSPTTATTDDENNANVKIKVKVMNSSISEVSLNEISENNIEQDKINNKMDDELKNDFTEPIYTSRSTPETCSQQKQHQNKRNFIRENILNASLPRRTSHTQQGTPSTVRSNVSSIFGTNPFGNTSDCYKSNSSLSSQKTFSTYPSLTARMLHKMNNQRKNNSTQTETANEAAKLTTAESSNSSSSTKSSNSFKTTNKHTSPVYSFQTERKREGSQYFWMTLSPTASAGQSKNRSHGHNKNLGGRVHKQNKRQSLTAQTGSRRKLFTATQRNNKCIDKTTSSTSLMSVVSMHHNTNTTRAQTNRFCETAATVRHQHELDSEQNDNDLEVGQSSSRLSVA